MSVEQQQKITITELRQKVDSGEIPLAPEHRTILFDAVDLVMMHERGEIDRLPEAEEITRARNVYGYTLPITDLLRVSKLANLTEISNIAPPMVYGAGDERQARRQEGTGHALKEH